MVTIRQERPADAIAREVLLDLSFGACRFTKTSERLREGRRPAEGLSVIAAAPIPSLPGRRNAARPGNPSFASQMDGRVKPGHDDLLVGTVRLWHVAIDERPALLLGPLAVHPDWRKCGTGAALMQHTLAQAEQSGHAAVLLVGDAPYYARFGFSAEKTSQLLLPGPYERDRLLACELKPGALDGARGMIVATGLPIAPFSRRVLTSAPAHPIRLPQAA